MSIELDGYFEATRPAVQHMFAALQQYDALTPAPSLAFHADEHGVVRFSAATAGNYMEKLSQSLALEFAKATLCGSIAQVAYMALRQYSQNTDVAADCVTHERSNSNYGGTQHTGRLMDCLHAARERNADSAVLSSEARADLDERLAHSCELLSLPETPGEITARFLSAGFIEAWVDEPRRAKRVHRSFLRRRKRNPAR